MLYGYKLNFMVISSWCLKYKHIILQKSTWIVIKTKQHQTWTYIQPCLSVNPSISDKKYSYFHISHHYFFLISTSFEVRVRIICSYHVSWAPDHNSQRQLRLDMKLLVYLVGWWSKVLEFGSLDFLSFAHEVDSLV